jgi:hypothetical protein
MNWIQQHRTTGPKADDFNAILAKIDAGDTSTRLAQRVAEIKDTYAGGDAEFALWLSLIDFRLQKSVGIGLFDLADWPMRDAFEDGMSPREALTEALRNDDTFGGLA